MKKIALTSAISNISFSVAALFCTSAAIAAATTATPNVTTAPATEVSADLTRAKKPIFALVAAVGDQFTLVRQKEQVGSNMLDNNTRSVFNTDSNVLNMAVLRGLDTAISRSQPDSERVFITLSAAEMQGVLPQDREAVAIGKVVSALEKMPARMNWEKIIVATPKYLFSERLGMGPKLHGLGVYVQPLKGAKIDLNTADGPIDINPTGQGESDTVNPEDGTKSTSKVYVAPYSYIQVYVLDAKTLRVLEKNARHDFTKLNDPTSTALDVGKSIPLDMLATRITSLIERSAARAVGETEVGVTVTIDEVKPGAAPAKK